MTQQGTKAQDPTKAQAHEGTALLDLYGAQDPTKAQRQEGVLGLGTPEEELEYALETVRYPKAPCQEGTAPGKGS